jgi:hypothetical protein
MKWKPLKAFHTYTRKYKGAWVGDVSYQKRESYCIPCQSKKKNIADMVQKTGITPAERLEMLEAVGGRCAICGIAKEKMCIDHDHVTGVVRGVLCNDCNLALGGFEDSSTLLASALNHLTNPQKKEN